MSLAKDLFISDDEEYEVEQVQPKLLKLKKRSRCASAERSEPSTSSASKKVGEPSAAQCSDPPASAASKKVREPSTTVRSERPALSASKRAGEPFTTTTAPKKRKTLIHPISPVMKPTMGELFGSDSDEDVPEESRKAISCEPQVIRCEKCNIEVPEKKYQYHIRTNIHKKNCLLKTEFKNIDIIATAFKNRIVAYRINPAQEVENLTPEAFLCHCKSDVFKVINLSLQKHTCLKLNLELFAYFVLPQSETRQLKSFSTKFDCVFNNTDINELYLNALETFKQKLSEFEHCESGWSLLSVSHLELNINKYCPMRGGTFIELPSVVKNSKSCLNIQNKDEHCFLWSIVAALFPAKSNVCKTSSYPHYSTVLKTDGMTFPPSCKDIQLFEASNDISINIYGLSTESSVTGPLYLSKNHKKNHVNLLYFENGNKGHYCLIKDLIRLVRRQISKSKGKMFMCEKCLQFFSSEIKYTAHDCSQVLTVLPEKNSTIGFKHFERQQKINFVIYADFESLLVNCTENSTGNTRKLKVHQPSCFAYYICCSHDPSLNKFVSYRGSDCVEVFIERLIEDAKCIHKILSVKNPMMPLTKEQVISYQNATTCHICGHLLFDDKVRDHDHVSSEYRGPAHSHCNLMLRVCPFIPVVFHNLTNYDSHLFIRELAKYNGPVTIIPKTKEKYLTITKYIDIKGCTRPLQIKFIDSFQFLSTSLDLLSKNLSDRDFIHLSENFENTHLHLLKSKGIYPYDYMDSWEKYEENALPSKKHFFNSLKMEDISDAEFHHAQSVWNAFNINNLGEYTDLYLKCDVLLLCDVFENFRNLSLKFYKLDPAYYITSPSLSWDAMLLSTGIKLDLIDDLEIYQMLERGIRGGLVQCSQRYAKANNKYLPEFDDLKPSSYLIYLDCNNLYGYAMTKSLPYSEFKFLNKYEIETFNIFTVSENGDTGYILEVDLEYPENLHDLHCDLPFAPEKFIPPGGKSPKLIASLYDKYNYVIHYVHLKEILKNGLILRKIHRILSFRQSNFLQKYIDLNTNLRQASESVFEKDFFKLMNNAIFGKTIENRRKQVDVKLITIWNDKDNTTKKRIGAETLISRPNLKNISVFSENFLAAQFTPEKIVLDRPIYIGFSVLEYAKQHLYKFHYDFMKRIYNQNAKLCYTDTDSLLYLIFTEDVYRDIKNNLNEFDTSNFDLNNPYSIERVNAKIPGLFKDELGGDVITEFAGLRAKLYSLHSVKTRLNKAKGVSKCITKNLTLTQYKDSLFNAKHLKCKMNLIKSIRHVLYSQELNKTVLNSTDDKRQILPNKINTLPWGHYKTMF